MDMLYSRDNVYVDNGVETVDYFAKILDIYVQVSKTTFTYLDEQYRAGWGPGQLGVRYAPPHHYDRYGVLVR